MKCGLLGRKLGHSYSPQIHAMLGSYSYALFEKEPEELEAFLKSDNWDGINVTVPYKKAVIPYLDELTPTAQKLGAVNTVIRRNGKLIGHNTDCYGFQTMVKESGLEIRDKKVLVLGSGGASNTAAAVLEEMGACVVIISRSGTDNYGNLHRHADAAVIVNTTPVGMYPATESSPVDLNQFPRLEGVLDLIYNPARTVLIQQAEEKGIPAMNGLLMLVAQAKEASECFQDTTIPEHMIHAIHRSLADSMRNIILIGMPGCGKSTVGKALAERTGRRFVDADRRIAELAGKSIPEIFAQDGEAEFRRWETAALRELCKESGLVIATGGGCVTQKRNYPLLHQNGVIIWLQRDLALLPTDGRPLSQPGKLEQMFEQRRPLYEAFADGVVDNSATAEETVMKLLEV